MNVNPSLTSRRRRRRHRRRRCRHRAYYTLQLRG